MIKPLIEWDEQRYSVGICKMDSQHRQLVDLLNALHSPNNTKDQDLIDRALKALIAYTKQHFVDEERILKKLNYPRLEGHHEQHQNFIETLNGLRNSYEKTGKSVEMIQQLTAFLSEWLMNHILVEDRAYRNYLES